MDNFQQRFDDLLQALREHNCRLTPQRVELIRLIAASEGHPNASQLFSQIQEKFPTMSQATVYNTLSLLKEIGQVLEINLQGDSHYDGVRPQPHPHLICIKCQKIMDADVLLDQASMEKVEKSSGYTILRPQITLFGLCPDCQHAD